MRLRSSFYVLCLARILTSHIATSQIKIVPGTKWCGDGSEATHENDLGFFTETDKCCRKHDQCADYILAKSWKYGLKNNYSFTSSECQCDFEFRKCLRAVRGKELFAARQVGIGYFTIINPMCFFKMHGTPCISRYYDEQNVSYKNDNGGKYFCAVWYRNAPWHGNR
ncbi:hypothetical protein KM043_011726 [Ampulex compressa]|nr:hypothetical protein KM043_011726 [Ampulex compressa]